MNARWLVLALYALGLVVCALAGRDFYKILEISRGANEDQIKKAYRKLSMKYHPDRNGGSKEAQEKFQDVAAAYEALSSKEKRRVYDREGEEGLNRFVQQQQQGAGGGGFNPFDIFSQFFGGGGSGGGGGGHHHEHRRRGPEVEVALPVSLEDLYVGRSIDVEIKKQGICHHCRGSGADGHDSLTQCPHCRGQGKIVRVQEIAPGFVTQTRMTCDRCQGQGTIIKKVCPVCRGKKTEKQYTTLQVSLEAGTPDGTRIEHEDAGDEHPDHPSEAVVFVVNTIPHPRFERRGDDLHLTQHISLLQSLTGFKLEIPHLDGHVVKIARAGVTRPSAVLKVANEGMPKHQAKSERGSLYVNIVVDFPESLTQAQKDGFAKIL